MTKNIPTKVANHYRLLVNDVVAFVDKEIIKDIETSVAIANAVNIRKEMASHITISNDDGIIAY